MTFKRHSIKHSKAVRGLITRARGQELAPTDLKFYLSNKAVSNPVSKQFNAYKISDRQRFTLKAYGKPFNYQGVMTKRYDATALMKLFFVDRRTIQFWVAKGYLPEPMIKIIGKTAYWFYHQIQPVYVWYWSRRARGLRTMDATEPEYKLLLRMLKAMDRRWYAMLGIEYYDPYARIAGKYGVMHLDGD